MVFTKRCLLWSLLLVVLLAAVVIVCAFWLVWHSSADQSGGSSNSTGSRAVPSLKFLIVVTRHGNRRLYTFPNDPYPPTDKSLWPYEMGALTVKGRVELYNVGVKIRSLYNGFLDEYFYGDEFYATSTPFERNVMSGQAFVAGVYPPLDFEIWNKNLLWQPIPVYQDSPDKLPVFNAGTCPRLAEALLEARATCNEMYGANYTAVNDYLQPYTGETQNGSTGFFMVWDAFIAEDSEGYVLPDWVAPVYPEPMSTLAAEMYIYGSVGLDVEVRLIAGPLVQQMTELMQSKANGSLSPDRQMYLYSSHDVTIVALQASLGIPKSSMIGLVKPGSAMVYELHQDPTTQQFYVEVLYIDGGSKDLEPVAFDIPNCGQPCDLTLLNNNTYKYRNITDYDAECQLNYTSTALF